MKRILIIAAASMLGLSMGTATAQDAASMAELLSLIEQGQALTHRAMFLTNRIEPVLSLETVFIADLVG